MWYMEKEAIAYMEELVNSGTVELTHDMQAKQRGDFELKDLDVGALTLLHRAPAYPRALVQADVYCERRLSGSPMP